MKLVPSHKENFFKVIKCDSITKKFIFSLSDDKRFLEDVWHIHKSVIVEVLRKAKSTKLHQSIDLTELPIELRALISKILNGKTARPKLAPANTKISHYATLHLTSSAPIELVHSAWKVLALLHHPDRNGDPEVFLKIKQAYDIITSTERAD